MTAHSQHAAATLDQDAMRADVRKYIKRWKISHRDLGRAIGMTGGNLSRWLDGKHRFGLDYVVSVAHVCDLDLNKYVREQETKL